MIATATLNNAPASRAAAQRITVDTSFVRPVTTAAIPRVTTAPQMRLLPAASYGSGRFTDGRSWMLEAVSAYFRWFHV